MRIDRTRTAVIGFVAGLAMMLLCARGEDDGAVVSVFASSTSVGEAVLLASPLALPLALLLALFAGLAIAIKGARSALRALACIAACLPGSYLAALLAGDVAHRLTTSDGAFLAVWAVATLGLAVTALLLALRVTLLPSAQPPPALDSAEGAS